MFDVPSKKFKWQFKVFLKILKPSFVTQCFESRIQVFLERLLLFERFGDFCLLLVSFSSMINIGVANKVDMVCLSPVGYGV